MKMPKPTAMATSAYWPAPAAMPSPAASQILAADVRFLTLPLAKKIAPAAMKPIACARPWMARSGSIPVSRRR
jgi:hypothetical protein